jgi:hypothetical protein
MIEVELFMNFSVVGLLSLTFALLSPTLLALDPAMLNLVSPTASSLVGVDMVRVQASPFGAFLTKTLTQQVGDLDKIVSATGFDPRRDLQEILVAASTTGATSASNHGLIIARGVFDQQRLLGMAKVAGLLQTGYKGVTLLTPQQGNSDFQAAAFLAGYFVAGSRADVEGAIDRSLARTASNGLATRALLASTKYDAWLVTSMPSDLANATGGAQGIPLRGINSVAGGVQFGSLVDIGIEAEARSTQDATSLADVLRLAAAFGQSNQAAAQIGNILNTLTISTDGNIVRASLKVPQADLEKMLNNNGPVARPARVRRVASR